MKGWPERLNCGAIFIEVTLWKYHMSLQFHRSYIVLAKGSQNGRLFLLRPKYNFFVCLGPLRVLIQVRSPHYYQSAVENLLTHGHNGWLLQRRWIIFLSVDLSHPRSCPICKFVRYLYTHEICRRQKKRTNKRSASLCSFSDTTGHMIIKLLSNTIVRFHCLTLEGKRFENEGSTPSVAN